ncbi:lysozyme C, tracheal isozyme [Parasteatoda tepidariorum]|uniref:lysozyme C, tracheal isozyme n=1 Tax=Parasteatoda tepidariorum TaxID=114398 RepID=UPI00077FD9BA|nr:lysozyme C [Parasteatoda tepidariorum]
MSPLAAIFISFSLINDVQGKILQPCEVAEAMISLGQSKINAAKWVCLAKFASGFNTQALSEEQKDGSFDFGVFQINDKFCRLGSKHNCGVPCTDLVKDNVRPSASCALKIFQKEGFKQWPAFKNNCQNIDTSRFIIKCSLRRKRNAYPFLREKEIRHE